MVGIKNTADTTSLAAEDHSVEAICVTNAVVTSSLQPLPPTTTDALWVTSSAVQDTSVEPVTCEILGATGANHVYLWIPSNDETDFSCAVQDHSKLLNVSSDMNSHLTFRESPTRDTWKETLVTCQRSLELSSVYTMQPVVFDQAAYIHDS